VRLRARRLQQPTPNWSSHVSNNHVNAPTQFLENLNSGSPCTHDNWWCASCPDAPVHQEDEGGEEKTQISSWQRGSHAVPPTNRYAGWEKLRAHEEPVETTINHRHASLHKELAVTPPHRGSTAMADRRELQQTSTFSVCPKSHTDSIHDAKKRFANPTQHIQKGEERKNARENERERWWERERGGLQREPHRENDKPRSTPDLHQIERANAGKT